MDGGIGREQRGSVAGREPRGEPEVEAPQERGEVVAPRDRHGHVPHRVLEDQVPPDDPRHQLAEGGVAVGVGAPRLRDHRRELGVAQPGQSAGHAEEEERQDQRRARAAADQMARRVILPRRRGADGAEDPGADHGADGEHDQVAGPERPLQGVGALTLDEQLCDRLAGEET